MDDSVNAKRVLKNTLSLYLRMVFLVLVSLYTVRVVLQILGASDYGINNVVGGVVSMMSFLTGTLTIAAQRYFSIHIAYRDWTALSKMFSVNIVVNGAFGILVFILAETVGLWFVIEGLTIPDGRMMAAVTVYEFSVFTFIISLIVAPIMALLVADENLSIYSVVSILEGILKLLVVYFLLHIDYDSLIVYAVLNFMTVVFVNFFYCYYAKIKYSDIEIKFYHKWESYKEVTSFMNWSLLGAIASVMRNQGLNILINIFFGTVINAARGISFQINAVILSFSQNFMKAIDPQITKSYAKGEKEKFRYLICASSKLSFFLLYIICLPLILNLDFILRIWLREVPEYTMIFTILVLIDGIIAAITDPLFTAVQAVGKIRFYQMTVGVTALLNLPLAYIGLLFIPNPLVPFTISILITFMMGCLRIYALKKEYCMFSVKNYLEGILQYIAPTLLIGYTVSVRFFSNADTLDAFAEHIILCMGLIIILIFLFGLTAKERDYMLGVLKRKLRNRDDINV